MFGAKTVLDICTNAMKKVSNKQSHSSDEAKSTIQSVQSAQSTQSVKSAQHALHQSTLQQSTLQQSNVQQSSIQDTSHHMQESYKYIKNHTNCIYIRFIMDDDISYYFKLYTDLNQNEINNVKFYLALLSSLGFHYRPDINKTDNSITIESADVKYWSTIFNHVLERKEKIQLTMESLSNSKSQSKEIKYCYIMCLPTGKSIIHYDVGLNYH